MLHIFPFFANFVTREKITDIRYIGLGVQYITRGRGRSTFRGFKILYDTGETIRPSGTAVFIIQNIRACPLVVGLGE